MMNAKNGNVVFDIVSNVEGASIKLDEAADMLFLFKEMLQESADWLDAKQPYTVALFNARIKRLFSMLNTIEDNLGEASNAIKTEVNKYYRLMKEERLGVVQ